MFPRFWKYTEPYYHAECDWEDCVEEYTVGVMDLWVTPCFAYQIQFNEVSAISAEKAYTGGWVYITYSYVSETATNYSVQTEISLSVNNV
jgi:hypothetical protein